MADDKELKKWVSDQLHSLLGFAEGAVAQYIVSVAKKHTSADSLATALRQQGLPASSETNRFASELLSKIPRAGRGPGGPSAYQQQARIAKDLVRKNQSYGLLDEPDEPEVPKAPAQPPAPAAGGRKIRDKKAVSWQEDEDDDKTAQAVRQSKKQKRAWEEDSDDEADREARLAEAARLKDQQEKAEFEERLRAKDEQRTKKLAETKLSKAEQKEEAKRK